MRPLVIRLGVIALVLALWEILPRIGAVPKLILSPFSESIEVAFRAGDVYLANLWITLAEIGAALLIACGGGVLAGGALGAFPRLCRLLLPFVSSAYAVPFVVLFPLFTAWLGIGSLSKIVFAGIYGFIPAVLTTAAGVRAIDRHLLLVARALGARGPALILKVVLPAAIPVVLSAVKVGAALVVVGVIVSEMLVSTGGIGYLIAQNRTAFNTPEVYLAILVVVVIAWMIERAIFLLERRFATWSLHTQKSARDGAGPRKRAVPWS